MRKHWWRVVLVVATLVLAAFSWREPVVAVFAVVPVLFWCLASARSDGSGLAVGPVLVALAAWILLPRALGLFGRWVPSVFEVCLLLPVVTTVILAVGLALQGWRPAVGLTVFVVAGLLVVGYTAVSYSEGVTGDEGVWPGPTGLRVVAGDTRCGSGGCARELDATGDDAPERMRACLASRGFTTPRFGGTWMCRVTGLLLTYDVCAKQTASSPTEVRVTWAI